MYLIDNGGTMDLMLVNFVSNNWLTITFVLAILKGLAKITPWANDDKIVQVFSGAFDMIKNRKK